MKKKNNRLDQLFDKLRQSPTELSLEKMESIISLLPNLPTKPTRNNDWTNFFNFKNIIMIAIPIISITIALLSYNGKEEISNNIKTIENIKIENTSDVFKPDEELLTMNLPTSPTTTSSTDTPKKNQKFKTTIDSGAAPTKKELPVLLPKDVVKKDPPKILEKKVSKTTDKNYRQGMSFPKPIIDNEPTTDPTPKMTGMSLRTLKRVLYRNLKADGIVATKSTPVKIELSGNQIVINDKVLDGNLFLKYSQLTQKAGRGTDRKIKMNDQHIMVGDFTAAGFKGSGVGTFVTKFAESDNGEGGLFGSQKFPPQEIDLEQKELNLFSQQILDKTSWPKGNKKLFSPSLDIDRSRELIVHLYKNLVSDQLIFSDKDYVLLELAKKEMRINGKKINNKLYPKYTKLFSDYKIKRGPIRQLRMSEHILQLGDFKNGIFSGTTLTFPEN